MLSPQSETELAAPLSPAPFVASFRWCSYQRGEIPLRPFRVWYATAVVPTRARAGRVWRCLRARVAPKCAPSTLESPDAPARSRSGAPQPTCAESSPGARASPGLPFPLPPTVHFRRCTCSPPRPIPTPFPALEKTGTAQTAHETPQLSSPPVPTLRRRLQSAHPATDTESHRQNSA